MARWVRRRFDLGNLGVSEREALHLPRESHQAPPQRRRPDPGTARACDRRPLRRHLSLGERRRQSQLQHHRQGGRRSRHHRLADLLPRRGLCGKKKEAERVVSPRCGATRTAVPAATTPSRGGYATTQIATNLFWTCKDILTLERHGARTLHILRARIAQRFLALAACVALNHRLGRPSRALVDYVA